MTHSKRAGRRKKKIQRSTRRAEQLGHNSELVVFHPPPLNEEERTTIASVVDAFLGTQSDAEHQRQYASAEALGKAVILYLGLYVQATVFGDVTGATEAQKVESIATHWDAIPVVDPVTSIELVRLVSVGMRGDIVDLLPKPTPFVALMAYAMLNKLSRLLDEGIIFRPHLGKPGGRAINVSAQELVTAWGLSEWLANNPDINISGEEFGALFEGERQSQRRTGTEARWKASVREIVRRLGTKFDDVLSAIEDALDTPEPDGFEFTSVNHDFRTIGYLANGKQKDITFTTLSDFIRRPKKNNLR